MFCDTFEKSLDHSLQIVMRLKKINDWQLPKHRNCNGIFSDPLKKYKLRHSSSRK